MLLKGYRKEIVRPECRPEAQSVHCIAYLDEDITQVIPYLNAVLGGFQYLKDPPSVSFKVRKTARPLHRRARPGLRSTSSSSSSNRSNGDTQWRN
jgi:hypothetical protein